MSRILRLLAVAILFVSIALMIGPAQALESASGVWDKGAHFVTFGLILWSFGVLFRRLPRLAAAALAIGLGAVVEVVQGMVGRDAEWGDIFADSLGVAAALFLWALWRGFRARTALQRRDFEA
ncbi:VanZ family protein [Brevundimonas sp.]|uniref:VanZ family protein n=1 Tax=Brevundimonas sp. TaxID=1871086 RepID=UPI002D5CA178|nr:VanZ family protein [Brevundimonas sp.]HYD27946.1 VanZ family protein [Brevundimonas sp.]